MTWRQSQWYGQAGAWLQVRLILNKLVHLGCSMYIKLNMCMIDCSQAGLIMSLVVQLGTGCVCDWLTTGKSLHRLWQYSSDTNMRMKLDMCMIDWPQVKAYTEYGSRVGIQARGRNWSCAWLIVHRQGWYWVKQSRWSTSMWMTWPLCGVSGQRWN